MEVARSINDKPDVSTLAIASLILGILTWTALPVTGAVFTLAMPMSILILPTIGALATSICARLALKKIRLSGGALGGTGLAKAGQVLAYAEYGLLLLLGLYLVVNVFLLHPRMSILP
ncbi:hypothetical protein [Dyella sp. 20L07]|uniref:hypothetical protein n=1 Tax=Dyella sp. 20L07 TaxID=3384240 RepID=UPI003D2CE0E0